MDIKMNSNRRGCENGFDSIQYSKGIVYFDVPHNLATYFIRKGWAHIASLQEMDEQLERAREDVA